MTECFDKSRCEEISNCKYGIKKCNRNIAIANEWIDICQWVWEELFGAELMKEGQRKSLKLFFILSCILNFSFDCISNKLCTHWCCIKCCEHQHESLENQIQKFYIHTWISPNRTDSRNVFDLPKPRKMTLYNLQLNFIFSLLSVILDYWDLCEIEFWFLMTGFQGSN